MTKCITALAVGLALFSGCTNKPTVTEVRCKDGIAGMPANMTTFIETGIGLNDIGFPDGQPFHLVYTYWSDGTVTNNYDWYLSVRNTESNRNELLIDIVGSC